jgi:V8-like Glu-specific endopeptidase
MGVFGGDGRGTVARLALLVLLSAGLLGTMPGAALAHEMVASSPRAQQALRFWTPARMKAAKPLDLDLPGGSQVALDGPRDVPGESPHLQPPTTAGEALASSSFEAVPNPTSEISRQTGVIFIATFFGLERCSGTSVNAPNYSVVLTAGHCVYTGGRSGHWMDRNWVFVPGYRYGQRPFGVFPAKWIDTTRQWRMTGSENADVGAAVVGRNQRGELLAKAVGGAGIAWGMKAQQVFDVRGYPAEKPFNGETQRLCAQTPFLGHDVSSFFAPGPLNLAVDCDVTGGASGGGWTISGSNVLNSVTNYGYGDDPNTDFGAYFGKEVGGLFRRAGSVR